MFAEENACSICGQKIVMINDAALDHHVQYWKGGETVPENARLAHRTCNLKRGKGV
jgi:5-methylcytosine-specific restriction endonuclease McrA